MDAEPEAPTDEGGVLLPVIEKALAAAHCPHPRSRSQASQACLPRPLFEMTPRAQEENKAFIFINCFPSLKVPERCLSGGVGDSYRLRDGTGYFCPRFRHSVGSTPAGAWATQAETEQRVLKLWGGCSHVVSSGVSHPLKGDIGPCRGRTVVPADALFPPLLGVSIRGTCPAISRGAAHTPPPRARTFQIIPASL